MLPATLVIGFNRPDKLLLLCKAISSLPVSRLYFHFDGPRLDNRLDVIKIKESLEICRQYFPPGKFVKYMIQTRNLGCKNGVTSAIDWFFSQEEEGIILEDDCLPSADFFDFCRSGLDNFRHHPQVFHINGTNHIPRWLTLRKRTFTATKLVSVWGWATWRSKWSEYREFTSNDYENERELWLKIFKRNLPIQVYLRAWVRLFADLEKIDTWDLHWVLSVWKCQGVAVSPPFNYVSNIGMDGSGTHSDNIPDHFQTRLRTPHGKAKNYLSVNFSPRVIRRRDWLQLTVYRCFSAWRIFTLARLRIKHISGKIRMVAERSIGK